jgi:hypothetical protein
MPVDYNNNAVQSQSTSSTSTISTQFDLLSTHGWGLRMSKQINSQMKRMNKTKDVNINIVTWGGG